MMLKELPPDDPMFTYPKNIQKAIYLLAGIVARIRDRQLDMKPGRSLIKLVSDKNLKQEKHDEK